MNHFPAAFTRKDYCSLAVNYNAELLQRLGAAASWPWWASGGGKSSLVRCGLLSGSWAAECSSRRSWEIAVTHPGGNPLALDGCAAGGRPLRSQERTRRENLLATLSRSHFSLVGAVKQTNQARTNLCRRSVRGDLSLPRSRTNAAGSGQRVRQPASRSGGAAGSADLRRADDALGLHRRVRSV